MEIKASCPGIYKEEVHHRDEYDRGHQSAHCRIAEKIKNLLKNNFKIGPVSVYQQCQHIDSGEQHNHIEKIEIAYPCNSDCNGEQHWFMLVKESVDSNNNQRHINHRVDEIKMACAVNESPCGKNIREDRNQNSSL